MAKKKADNGGKFKKVKPNPAPQGGDTSAQDSHSLLKRRNEIGVTSSPDNSSPLSDILGLSLKAITKDPAVNIAGEILKEKLRTNLANNLDTRQGYQHTPLESITKAFKAGVLNIPNKSLMNHPISDDNSMLERDLFLKYLGKKPEYNTYSDSPYKPTKSKDKNAKYVQLNNAPLAFPDDMSSFGSVKKFVEGMTNPSGVTDYVFNTGLGDYTMNSGSDDKGDYISYYDKWDLSPFHGRDNTANKDDESFGIGKPFEVYGRVYYDKKTGRQLPQQQEKQENGGILPMAKSGIYIKPSHKGLLHKDLDVKQGEPIPASKLKVKSSDSAAVKKRKVFAQNAKKWHHGEDGLEITPIQKPLPSINDMISPDKLTRNSGSLTLPAEHQQQGHGVNWNPFLVGLNAIDTLIPGQKSHLPVVQPSMSYNDHPYGTGSQAIMDYGGMMYGQQPAILPKKIPDLPSSITGKQGKPDKKTMENSRKSAIIDLINQGVKDKKQILNYLNFDEHGNKVGDFTQQEVDKYTPKMLNGGDVPKGHWNRVQFMDDGGHVNYDSVLNANKEKLMVDRLLNARNYPVRRNPDGGVASHLMSSASDDISPFAYASITPTTFGGNTPDYLIPGGNFKNQSPKEAIKNKDIIRFKSDKEADDFATNYKNSAGYKKGSNARLPEYDDGGALAKKNAKKVTDVPSGYNFAGEESGRKYYNRQSAGTIPMATGGGKPGKEYDSFLQKQLQSGVSPDELVQKKYISPDAIGKYKQFYKPIQDYIYTEQGQQQAPAPQDNPAAAFHGEPIFMHTGVTNKAIGMAKYPARNTNTMSQQGNLNTGNQDVQFMYMDKMGKPVQDSGIYHIPFDEWNNRGQASNFADSSFINKYSPRKGMKYGGYMKGDNGLQMLDDNTIEFKGPSHENGGIPISYSGNKAEVEGGETGYMSPVDNSLHVMGNMTNPLTGKKFKKDSKVLANKENRLQKTMTNGASLLQEADPMDKYDMFKFNSGKAMLQGGMAKQKEITQSKEWLATLQKAMLDTANEHNLDPQKFSKGKQLPKYDDGGKVPISKIKTRGPMELPTMFSSGPMANATVTHNRIHPLDAGSIAQTPTVFSHDYNPPPSQLDRSPGLQLPDINGNDTTSSATDNDNPLGGYNGNNSFSNAQGLGLGQILPELYTLATNKQEPVWMQQYNPQMYSPYKVSFQDRRNQNTSTFDALKQAYNNNPAALSSLAGNLYDANNGVNAEEFRTNQGIQNDITNKNTQLLNEAQTTNLKLADDQYVRQAQAKANTKQQNRVVLQSISDKVHQNMLEQKTIGLYENLYPDFRFDPNSMKSIYEGDPNLSNYIQWTHSGGGVAPIDNADNKVSTRMDSDNNIKGTTITKYPTAATSKLKSQASISNMQALTRRFNLAKSLGIKMPTYNPPK